jgi:hypothetical protein
MIFPLEIIYEIYLQADLPTRINMNKAFNIPYTFANPLTNIKLLYKPKVYVYSPLNFIMRGH